MIGPWVPAARRDGPAFEYKAFRMYRCFLVYTAHELQLTVRPRGRECNHTNRNGTSNQAEKRFI
jgi:hypothetical protein